MRVGNILSLSLLVLVLSSGLQARGLCVKEEFANLRSGPGQSYPKSWVVYKFTPLESLEKKNSWYKVKDFEGREHWIREDLVSTEMKCAVIKDEYAFLRKGPGLKWPKKLPFRADKYVSFRVLARKGEWARVEDQEGDIVWIHAPLLWVR